MDVGLFPQVEDYKRYEWVCEHGRNDDGVHFD